MNPRVRSAKHQWGLAFAVANLAVLIVILVLLATGQIRTIRDFLHGLAFSLIFANLTSFLGVLIVGTALQKLPLRRQSILPFAILGIVIVVPLGCLAAQGVLVSLHLALAANFWPEYLHTLKVATPLALVFGLGAFVYSSLTTRLERAELQLREKELAEERTRKLAAEARLRSLESWIHPHFLFNTLNSISALIVSDPTRAEQIVGRLASLLRSSLDTSNHSLIPLLQELALVESYLDIERVRLGDRLRVRIDVPKSLENTSVPPMSVQSLAENAVKHGINPRPAGGEVLVTARESNGVVSIAVRNSGSGFDLAAVPAGHGLDKLVQRLDTLFGDKAGIHVLREEGFSVVEMVVPRR